MHSLRSLLRRAAGPERHTVRFGTAFLLLVLGMAGCEELDRPAAPDPDPASADSPGQAPVSPQAAAAKIGTGVRDALLAGEEVPVIITFEVPGQPRPGQRGGLDLNELRRNVASVRASIFDALAGNGLRLGRQYEVVPAVAGVLNSQQMLDRLARHPLIIGIQLNVSGSATLGSTVPLIDADERHTAGNLGEGITVAVLDTGVDTDHQDLVDDISIFQACFGDDDGTIDGVGFCPDGSDRQLGPGAAEDDKGHGTHVTGIITSAGTISPVGVAPGANIIPVKVMDSNGTAGRLYFFSEVIAAWDWIAVNNNVLNVSVINMSLGAGAPIAGDCDTTYPAEAIAATILRIVGITIVAAAGNDTQAAMRLPACLSDVISVGSSTDGDVVSGFSNASSTTDLFAPGSGVTSTWFDGSTSNASGTSMATPHVVGCAALLMEAGEVSTPDELEARLETSSISIFAFGNAFPRLDCGALPATVTIRKATVPAGRTGFSFLQDMEAPFSFNLDDGGSRTFNDVAPGAYSVSEGAVPFSTLTGLICSEDGTQNTTTDPQSLSATVRVEPGETIDCTFTNTDSPPRVSLSRRLQDVQYSDNIIPITVTAEDSDQDALTVSTSWNRNGSAFAAGLPSGLSLTATGCASSGGVQTCTWTIDGAIGEDAATYMIRATATDSDGDQASDDGTIEVSVEDATPTFDANNPMSAEVAAAGGTATFTLTLYVEETEPDLPAAGAAPGDLSNAVVTLDLVPLGPGGSIGGNCVPGGVSGVGYDQVLTVDCSFANVPVNLYSVLLTVTGGYYAGESEDLVTVFDPSLGFTTGGGWFYWPGTTDRTSFGYSMKYNRNGNSLRGSLMLIRHLPDGTKYRIRSNALYGLALGDAGAFDWASFNGKSTYQEPDWDDPIGNHEFLVYVEDRGQPGAGLDRFWFQLLDRNGLLIPAISMADDPQLSSVTIGGGNVLVPRQNGGNRPD
jgi:subtilisin family serine protease